MALAGLHQGEILPADELPLRYAGYSTCFRREAGAAGRDTRGIFRVHQFDKVEMFFFADPERSEEHHEEILAIEEDIVGSLGIAYRVVVTAAGDLGPSAAKKYDVEAWIPSQQRYREITSCSNTTDYQARRLNVRFRDEDGSLRFVHTLNGTAMTARFLIALLEANQDRGARRRARGAPRATAPPSASEPRAPQSGRRPRSLPGRRCGPVRLLEAEAQELVHVGDGEPEPPRAGRGARGRRRGATASLPRIALVTKSLASQGGLERFEAEGDVGGDRGREGAAGAVHVRRVDPRRPQKRHRVGRRRRRRRPRCRGGGRPSLSRAAGRGLKLTRGRLHVPRDRRLGAR